MLPYVDMGACSVPRGVITEFRGTKIDLEDIEKLYICLCLPVHVLGWEWPLFSSQRIKQIDISTF